MGGDGLLSQTEPPFRTRFIELFGKDFPKVFRYLTRLSGDAELASDLAQETFLRLYRRGAMPERPEAWIITVAMNLFRNERSKRRRRRARLTKNRAEGAHSDPWPSPAESLRNAETSFEVRRALDRLSPREREMLLLRAEGYAYREIASALDLHEASVGTLLARARSAFREAFEGAVHAR